MKHFALTEDHVKLVRGFYVAWEDAENGAPAIDCKRPYGNSSIVPDICELLGWEPAEDDDGEQHWPKGTRDNALRLHSETGTALQVILSTGAFEPGEYVADDYRRNWRKA